MGRLRGTYEALSAIMSTDSNCEKYRKKLEKAKSPCVPFLGQSLTDIVFHYEMSVKNKQDPKNVSNLKAVKQIKGQKKNKKKKKTKTKTKNK